MSGNGFLLDTNILIGLFANQAGTLELLGKKGVSIEASFISCLSRIEVLSFSQLSDEEVQTLDKKLSLLVGLPIDRNIEDLTIQIRRQRKIKTPDAIILATAVQHGFDLVTLDKDLLSAFESITQQKTIIKKN